MGDQPLGVDKCKTLFKEIFDGLDTNKDGGVVWKELENNIGSVDPEKAKQFMDLADTNKDKRIDFDEFLEFVHMIMKSEDLSMDKLTQDHINHFKKLFAA
eukprot:TRINITY_DN1282_c4_g1_i1.p1 TRINITY_DN1282_c4_g1~~TRINITY_DN1282_c4_g1_i1.p1  ORF type:complete len:116 (+),score=25.60 TRINITY_DN1282_c4_g1_i1:49-348(+)